MCMCVLCYVVLSQKLLKEKGLTLGKMKTIHRGKSKTNVGKLAGDTKTLDLVRSWGDFPKL